MEERDRVKIVTYEGSKQIDRTKIEEQLRDRNLVIAADSLLDERKIRQVEGVVRDMMVEKGFNPEVTHTHRADRRARPRPSTSPSTSTRGRKVKIRKVDFVGNEAFTRRQAQETAEGEQADGHPLVHHRDRHRQRGEVRGGRRHGSRSTTRTAATPASAIGQPELKVLEDTKDGKTQWVELRHSGHRGSAVHLRRARLRGQHARAVASSCGRCTRSSPGEIYSRKKIVEGNRKAQEVYGELGFMEFTPFPELLAERRRRRTRRRRSTALVPEALTVAERSPPSGEPRSLPHVDVTIRVTEGEQFFVNRIVFTGNTTTRDNVIRRELGRLRRGRAVQQPRRSRTASAGSISSATSSRSKATTRT